MEKVFKTIKKIIVVIVGTCIVSLITFVVITCFSHFSSTENVIQHYGKFEHVLAKSKDKTPVTDNKPEHNYYREAMKDEKNDINYVKDDGRFAYKYCFYDIDQNGVDELIVHGSYYNYSIYTLKGSKVEGLAWNKYGGGLKIYPAKGLVSWTGGHNDNYYIEFFRIKGNKVKETASKSWRNKLTEEDVYPYHYVYKVNGKKVTKKRYKKYVAALEKKKVIKGKDLKWCR